MTDLNTAITNLFKENTKLREELLRIKQETCAYCAKYINNHDGSFEIIMCNVCNKNYHKTHSKDVCVNCPDDGCPLCDQQECITCDKTYHERCLFKLSDDVWKCKFCKN